jgi:EAL domain-containing protein (putative c-di-GMP-specific phosphodiesterase class I)
MQQNLVKFNIPWVIYENYWLCAVLQDEHEVTSLLKHLRKANLRAISVGEYCVAVAAPKNWSDTWETLSLILAENQINNPKIAILVRKSSVPLEDEIMLSIESPERLDALVKNMWLAECLAYNKLECYFQPVYDKAESVYGYESFARIRQEDGQLITGQKIISAAKEMGIEHMLDKHLHMLSINTFAQSGLSGKLFINMATGFVQLPETYLRQLLATAKKNHIRPSRIVLDLNLSKITDSYQIAQITSFCHDAGIKVALDNVENSAALLKILAQSSPEFVKLDRRFSKFYKEQRFFEDMNKII